MEILFIYWLFSSLFTMQYLYSWMNGESLLSPTKFDSIKVIIVGFALGWCAFPSIMGDYVYRHLDKND